ncbi:malignant fibrous histiocytoma-amplified sequence 1 homolog isoform X2 [Ruditapes philippinarum]|uniref:malignant fibrous histiocytoma-amplified sequence 1 homolog isoform X2 n=1 Tax=Ruditapes philippinarum TaxID=129788 RepID=UPI00295B745A|nr:malignant fibrous histiocytoma-amplified sequence 1 homolog isoform X2 [Ruditapes philippinarum]
MSSTAAARQRKRPSSRGGISVLKGPTMAHVGFQGARHMHPERLPSAKRERSMSVRLFDTNEDTLQSMDNQSSNVKILMVNGLNMNNVSEGIVERMQYLQKLDLSENQLNDTSLPDSFSTLENLVELNLSNNKFSKLPSVIRKLRNLSRLSLSHNTIDSLKGLEKLKKMQVLMLDHNKFTSVFKDITHMRKLEILDCSFNSIREVGLDIRFLKNLRELNVTKNRISVLPTDVFQLSSLESLKAGQNQISKIPMFNMNPQHCHCLSEIDLSSNMLNKFPGHLLVITKKLDVSSNRIKTLEWNKMKKFELRTDKELSVEGNPLTFPPTDVCECGIKSMIQFFQETQLSLKVYQGMKILVLGAPGSGKTSFVQTLVDGQSRLSEEMYEKSAGIEVSDMTFENIADKPEPPPKVMVTNAKLEMHKKRLNGHIIDGSKDADDDTSSNASSGDNKKSLNLCIWDFCGNPFYLYPHYMFFEQPAIAILTFNMYTYQPEKFEEMVSSWFDWMIAKTNKLVVLLVGTHADKLKKDKMKSVCNEVKAKLQAHAEKQRQIVQKKIDEITEKPHISQTLSSQLNAYSLLLHEKFVVQSEVITTSAAKNTGYETIAASIEMLANDARQFPNVLRPIPTFWLDVESFVEERGNTMVVPIVKYEQLRDEIGDKFGMKHLLNTILQYLHETGKVLWFHNNAALKGHVILRPAWFFDIFRAIFRHDLKEKLDIEVEDSFKTIGITQSKYDQLKEEFLTEGIVDRDLLKCMLCHLLPLETNGPFYEVLDLLLGNLDLGYLVSKKSREPGYNLDPEKESMLSRKYLIPWFRNVAEPPSVKELWEPIAGNHRLAGVCRFPKYMPPGMFEMLTVRAHREKHRLRFLSHWGSGFHARHKDEKLQVMFTYQNHETDHGTTMRFEFRDDHGSDPHADHVSAAAMWTILLPLLMDFEELLHSYTGVLVERLMECPNCKLLSFTGEWLTPKETQGMATRPCVECNDEIDTAFLVQPREKKRDDVRLNLARMRQKRRDALKGSAGSKIKQVQAPVRHGRRAAIMPTESTLMSRPSISTAGENDSHSDTADDNKTRPTGLLPGLNEDEMNTFMTKIGNEADDGSDHSVSEDNGDTYSGQSSGLLPGLNPGEMASLMSKIGNDTDKESIAESETDENETQASGLLPGLNLEQMQSFMSKHAPEGEATSNNDSDADDNNVAPEMGLLPGLNPEQMASLMKTVGTSSIDDADSVQE